MLTAICGEEQEIASIQTDRFKKYTDQGIYVVWIGVENFNSINERRISERHASWHKMHNSVLFYMNAVDGNEDNFHEYKRRYNNEDGRFDWILHGKFFNGIFGAHFERVRWTKRIKEFDEQCELSLLELDYVENRDGQLVGCIPYNKRWF
jgi:Sec7-like guanine-nucleotide exchange factor